MSADNGIYILKTGRQYRVAHFAAADNLYWDDIEKDVSDKMQPKMILEIYGEGSRYTYNIETALNVAKQILKKISICEYGIVFLDAKMTWQQILNRSME